MNTILINKQNGDILGKQYVLQRLENVFQTLKNGEHILTLKKTVKQRSNNQNAMMWMWFTCLAQDTGATKDDFYDYYREKFLCRTIIINGKETKVTTGTSKLDAVAMTHFLNHVQADAIAEFGVRLPTPEDLYWEEFENYYKRFI
ncbi:MAG: hypothetical protein BGO29_14935 [Bacteroidales bacterium 36-12]|nr:MAG: hypothetical protein BGO29_14935 [Bacteroidales bacterium 36-12]